jgi:DNA-binding LytR/AlgR family response regulator
MPTALLADDEPLLREHLREKLQALWPELVIVAEASHGNQASAMLDQYSPDIAFLDIKMPGKTGIDVARSLRGKTRIVFVTAYDQFAVQAFESAAIDYLLKPVTDERLAQTIARLKTVLANTAPPADLTQILNLLSRMDTQGSNVAPTHLRWIRASRGDTTYQIAVDEVLYFQSDDKYTIVHTPNGEHVIRMSLAELAQSLDAEKFWQIHRSTLVNIRHVLSSKRNGDGRVSVVVKGVAEALLVSRAYQHLFRQM